MSVLIIRLGPGDAEGTTTSCEIEAPFALPPPTATYFIHLADLAGLDGPDVVRLRGRMLRDKLMENPRVAQALGQALTMPPASPTSLPICFHAQDGTAHALELEALMGPDAFLGLDPRWPIARISRGSQMQRGTVRVAHSPPLSLVCVLSAVGLSAAGEWAGIYESVRRARERDLPIRVTLLAGEEALIESARALGDAELTVMPVPEGETDLLARIRDAEPDLVHLFCHGGIVNEVRRLEIGHVRNHDPGNTESPVIVRPESLGREAAAGGAWAVVLNACQGADASAAGETHVETILNAGVPIGIGMRRQVEQADAETFSRALYPEIFRRVAAAMAAPPGHEISWPDALVQARRALVDRNGADEALTDAWTLPVLYMGFGPFELAPVVPAGLSPARRSGDEARRLESFHDLMLSVGAPADMVADSAALAPGRP